MGALRAAITIAAGLGLLIALMAFGHMLPWHRSVSAPDEVEPFKAKRSPQAEEPAQGSPDRPPRLPDASVALDLGSLRDLRDPDCDDDCDEDDERDDERSKGHGKHGKKHK